MGAKKPGAPRPRPIVAKFGYFKQKEQVKSRGRELKGTDFGVNDQFPKEILERRKFCSQSDAVSSKRAPELSSQWTGSTWTGYSTATSVPLRGYINTTPDKNPLYLSFFFSLSSLVLPFTSNYLCHFDNLIRYHNKHVQSVSAAFKWFCNVFVSVKFLLSSLYACFFVCLSYFQLLSRHRSPALLHI